MCSGIFQRFLLHMIRLGFEAILTKTKPVENAFACLKFHLHASTNNQWLHSRLFKILYIRSSFADITITFISIKFAVLWSDWFLRYFGKSNGAMSFSFFICLFKSKHNVQHNLFFAFKIKNCCYLCRFYHKRAFELIDWVIWLVNQFWLFHLNKHQLVKYY